MTACECALFFFFDGWTDDDEMTTRSSTYKEEDNSYVSRCMFVGVVYGKEIGPKVDMHRADKGYTSKYIC